MDETKKRWLLGAAELLKGIEGAAIDLGAGLDEATVEQMAAWFERDVKRHVALFEQDHMGRQPLTIYSFEGRLLGSVLIRGQGSRVATEAEIAELSINRHPDVPAPSRLEALQRLHDYDRRAADREALAEFRAEERRDASNDLFNVAGDLGLLADDADELTPELLIFVAHYLLKRTYERANGMADGLDGKLQRAFDELRELDSDAERAWEAAKRANRQWPHLMKHDARYCCLCGLHAAEHYVVPLPGVTYAGGGR